VLPRTVVKHFDVINDVSPRVLPGRILTMGRPFPLETTEEPFRHRIIETFSLPTHTTAHSRVGQEPLIWGVRYSRAETIANVLHAKLRREPHAVAPRRQRRDSRHRLKRPSRQRRRASHSVRNIPHQTSLMNSPRTSRFCRNTPSRTKHGQNISYRSMFGMRVIFPCRGCVQQSSLLRSVYWHDFWLVKSRSSVCRFAGPFSDTGSANHELL
jgi:hypothetical protein